LAGACPVFSQALALEASLNILSEGLDKYLEDKQERIETYLRSALELADGAPVRLLEAMRYSLLAPGKRLRPLLVLMAAEACGEIEGRAMPAAGAVEMVHAYSLIHDDLPAMDDDDLRRGLPTCHCQFGEALAILAGDALLTLAFQVLAENYPPATATACCRELARGAGASGMVGGQVEDLAWENVLVDQEQLTERTKRADTRGSQSGVVGYQTVEDKPTLDTLENIHARKTGALFRTCLRLGVWVARGEDSGGPRPELLAPLDEYGQCFGQAFQITDDLLDVEGHVDQTGKRVQKDANRGKLTYPGMLGTAASRSRAQRLCDQARSSLRPLGGAGDRLASLVDLIVERTR
jgi:geranylgeranyl diphosphate synthase, type II